MFAKNVLQGARNKIDVFPGIGKVVQKIMSKWDNI